MSQKILLLQDVDNVGRKGDIAIVKPGYAYNYLLPKKLAILATRAALRHKERLEQERREQAELDKNESEKLAEQLHGEVLEIEVKVDHEEHMYGSVTNLMILEHIKAKTGIELEKKAVHMKAPIKAIGVYDVPLQLKEGVTTQIQVKVIPIHGE